MSVITKGEHVASESIGKQKQLIRVGGESWSFVAERLFLFLLLLFAGLRIALCETFNFDSADDIKTAFCFVKTSVRMTQIQQPRRT